MFILSPGRLQYIYDALANNKTLYRSDSVYLESKLNSINVDDSVNPTLPKFTKTPPEKLEPPTISESEEIAVKPTVPQKEKGSMPKGWSPENKSDELEKIEKNISDEKQKINAKKKLMMKLTYSVQIYLN